MNSNYRHEIKYLLSYGEYLYLRQLMAAIMQRDSHAGEDGGYTISSLYFDTWSNRCYEEKQMGIASRYKIRLRTYGCSSQRVQLEIKNKNDQGIFKEAVTLSAEHTARLVAGEAGVLLEYHDPTAQKVYRLMRTEGFVPSVIVNYEREAFVLPTQRTRVTFDKNLRATKSVTDFNKGEAVYSEVSVMRNVVLEVKYDQAIPLFLRKALGSAVACRSSVSKYCLARRVVT